jgi:hypothetical protein
MDSAIPPPAPFKDRKTGLVIFGAATTLMGLCCALFVPLVLLAALLPAGGANPSTASRNILPVAILYGALAVVFIWLGIGSIMARRWARALLVVASWTCLISGLGALVMAALMGPQLAAAIRAAQPPGRPELSGTAGTMMIIVLIILGSLFVLLPLLWALFYSGKNAKATCEARDPVVRWTDHCPLIVLTVSVWLACEALMMTMLPLMHQAATPFFGLLVPGVPGMAWYWFLAVIWAYGAWAIYRLDRRGWWVIFIATILFCLSNVMTYSRHDIREVYASMGDQTAQIAESFMGGNRVVWSSLLFVAPFLGLLFYIRKFMTGAQVRRE